MGKVGKFFKKTTKTVSRGATNVGRSVANVAKVATSSVVGASSAFAVASSNVAEPKKAETIQCPPPPRPPPDPVLSCNEKPYNISNMNGFNNYPNFNTLTQYQRNKWLVCLNENINSDNINNDNIVNTYNLLYNNNESTNEMNKYSLYLYNNDLIYIYSKIILLFILGGTYFYFFKIGGFNITGIIESTKKTIEELPNIKKKIENKINIK
jgi:hypothetical protein